MSSAGMLLVAVLLLAWSPGRALQQTRVPGAVDPATAASPDDKRPATASTSGWRSWLEDERQEFDEFRRDARRRWGEFVSSTRSRWVGYSEDLDSRAIVDFRSGRITVEVFTDVPAVEADDDARRRLEATLRRLVDGRSDESPGGNEADERPSPASALAGQVVDREGKPVTSENAEAFARHVARSPDVVSVPAQAADGITRVRHSVSVDLVPEHLRIRAEKYLPVVREMAVSYRLDIRLVLAVIHTESYFNPLAVSSAPAYGLMQLVPHHGGAEAYENVHGRRWVPTPTYLYDPRNNIELGCAYMRILLDRYMSEIDDPISRLHCAICAYNTGPGNVARVFSGSRRLRDAWKRVNALDQNEVLRTLKVRLPHAETREYIARVLERIPLYGEWAD